MSSAKENLLEAARVFASDSAAYEKEAIERLHKENNVLAVRYMMASRLLNHTRYTADQIKDLEQTIAEFDRRHGVR